MSVKNSAFFNITRIALLSLLSGCALDPKVFKTPYKSYNHPALLNEYQARFVDIPFPFDGEIRSEEIDKNLLLEESTEQFRDTPSILNRQFIIICSTRMLSSELCTLFHNEMEQLGWRERAFFIENAHDFTAVFEKPGNKLCIISVRSSHKSSSKKSIIQYYLA